MPSPQLLHSLQVLPSLPPPTTPPLRDIHKQLANGIAELVRSHAGTIKSPHDWSTLFAIVEYAATGLSQLVAPGCVSMSMRGGATEVEQEVGVVTTAGMDGEAAGSSEMELSSSHDVQVSATARSGWVWVSGAERVQKPVMSSLSQFDVLVEEALPVHEPQAFYKMCESLSYLVRSDQYVNTANFGSCLRCIRVFSEVSASSTALEHDRGQTTGTTGSRHGKTSPTRAPVSVPAHSDSEGKGATYTTASLQLLDLMDTLYSRVGRIFDEKAVARLQSETEAAVRGLESLHNGQVMSSDLSIESGEQDTSSGARSTADQVLAASSPSHPPPPPTCPQASEDFAVLPSGHACGLMWHIAWCPLLQGIARMCCDPRRCVCNSQCM